MKDNIKETLDKAYGGIPNEVVPYMNFDFFPFRGLKYYLIVLIRKITR
jgi:hypothetical protein